MQGYEPDHLKAYHLWDPERSMIYLDLINAIKLDNELSFFILAPNWKWSI